MTQERPLLGARRGVVIAAVSLALVLAMTAAGFLVRPLVMTLVSPSGEVSRHGVSTVVAGRSDARGPWGFNVKRGRVVLTRDGCLTLEDISGTELDGPRVVSWPRGSWLVGEESDVHVRLPSGGRIRPGDVIDFGAYAAYAAEHHVDLPRTCRTLPGLHLQSDLGPIEVKDHF